MHGKYYISNFVLFRYQRILWFTMFSIVIPNWYVYSCCHLNVLTPVYTTFFMLLFEVKYTIGNVNLKPNFNPVHALNVKIKELSIFIPWNHKHTEVHPSVVCRWQINPKYTFYHPKKTLCQDIKYLKCWRTFSIHFSLCVFPLTRSSTVFLTFICLNNKNTIYFIFLFFYFWGTVHLNNLLTAANFVRLKTSNFQTPHFSSLY